MILKTKIDMTALNRFIELVISVSVLDDAEGNRATTCHARVCGLIEDFDGHCYTMKIEKSHWSISRTAEDKVTR